MTHIFKKLPPFQAMAAAAAGTAIIPEIPQSRVYDAFVLKLGGTFVAADIPEIRLILGGKPIWRVSGNHLDTIDKYYNLTNDADFLPMHFDFPQAKTRRGRRFGCIDTQTLAYSDFSLEVELDGTQVGATLEALYLQGGPKPVDKELDTRAMFKAFLQSTPQTASAAEHTVTLPTGSKLGNMIRAFHFFHANLTHIGLKKDTVTIKETLPVADYQYMQKRFSRAIQSGHVALDMLINNEMGAMIDTLRPDKRSAAMEYILTTSAADTITAYSELLVNNINTI